MLNNIHYKAILETIADGVLIINKTGIVEFFNFAAEKMFGYSQGDIIGRNVSILMPEVHKNNHDQYLANYLKTRVSKIIGKTIEVSGCKSDGTLFPIDLSLSVLECEGDIKFIGVIRDITKRKEVEADLLNAKQDAEKHNRATTEFISSITHELRTPLNAILGFANLLEFDTSLTNTSINNARKIYSAGEHLLGLVNNLVDLARLEAGQVKLKNEPVSVNQVLEKSIAQVKDETRKKDIKLFADLRHCQNCYVYADEGRLEQIFVNILSNAIKFNKYQGKVIVNCQSVDNSQFRIMISDTGPGIPSYKLKSLFTPFNRLGEEKGRVEGTGIGLVIAERLVKLMGGSINVDSTLGQGSCFIVDLNLVRLESNVNMISPEDNDAIDKVTILVVEDNVTNRELFKQQLDHLGYHADTVEDGALALLALEQKNYDLVLTDINMPNINGYELATLIRKGYGSINKELTIIAVTANTNEDEIEKCKSVGINDYLSKPVNINDLNRKLSQWLDKKALSGIFSMVGGSSLTEPSEHFHPSILQATVGPDLRKHIIVLESYRNSSKQILSDIYAAYNSHNIRELVSHCHKLKSSSKAVGAVKLGQICQVLEKAGNANDVTEVSKNIELLILEYQEVETCFAKYLSRHSGTDDDLEDVCVLIIDDDLFSIELIQNLLEQRGVGQILSAMSGVEAIKLMQSLPQKIDILFCDLNMPTMDGIEILRYLSTQDYKGGIALISGENERVLRSAENLARARHLNLLGAIEKPLTSVSLDKIISCYQSVAERGSLTPDANIITPALLRKAISARKIETHFQPKVDMQSKRLVGVEALARWKQSKYKLTPPDMFIPLAEENNLIDEITELVFLNAFQQMAKWRSRNDKFSIALNISVNTLVNLDLPEIIVDYANRFDIPTENIVLEITETRLMRDISSALDILTRMSLKGIKLSIDDFGTGYSSMEQLQRAPFTELKLDSSFVTNADRDRALLAILESSINLAKKLDMTIVAEGIETQQDWDLLASLGADYAQGFFIARPMPAKEFDVWLKNWRYLWG